MARLIQVTTQHQLEALVRSPDHKRLVREICNQGPVRDL